MREVEIGQLVAPANVEKKVLRAVGQLNCLDEREAEDLAAKSRCAVHVA